MQEGKLAAVELDEIIAAAKLFDFKLAADPEFNKVTRLRAIAEVLARHNDEAALEQFVDQPVRGLRTIAADRCRNGTQWRQAAGWYHKEFALSTALPKVGEIPSPDPQAAMQEGYCLWRAGDKQAGEKLMEKADLLALGDLQVREGFAAFFEDVGQGDRAARERQFSQNISTDLDYGQHREYIMGRAMEAKDYSQLAVLRERARLAFLEPHVFVSEIAGFPWLLCQCSRARMLQAAMRRDARAVLAEMDVAEKTLPLDSDDVAAVVHELEKSGDGKTADQLFDKAWQARQRCCRPGRSRWTI